LKKLAHSKQPAPGARAPFGLAIAAAGGARWQIGRCRRIALSQLPYFVQTPQPKRFSQAA
jgi:hypothetical protein